MFKNDYQTNLFGMNIINFNNFSNLCQEIKICQFLVRLQTWQTFHHPNKEWF